MNSTRGMASGLYASERVFRLTFERCTAILKSHLGIELREALLHRDERRSDEKPAIDLRALRGAAANWPADVDDSFIRPSIVHPSIFVVEYAVALLLQHWGVRPSRMIGFSLGEYVAATLSGVMPLEEALVAVAERGLIIERGAKPGGMLAVPLPAEEARRDCAGGIGVGAEIAPSACVLSGPDEAITALHQQYTARGIPCQRLRTRHAFHSDVLAPVAPEIAALMRRVHLKPPEIPYVSNVTGTWITAEQATDPDYYARHACSTVLFEQGVRQLASSSPGALIEVGPGQGLAYCVKQHPALGETTWPVVSTLPGAVHAQSDLAFLLTSLGKLWLAGLDVDWRAFYEDEQRKTVSLPKYQFHRGRHWLLSPRVSPERPAAPSASRRSSSEWFYAPARHPSPLEAERPRPGMRWLVFADNAGLGDAVVDQLRAKGHEVTVVMEGERFERSNDKVFRVDARDSRHYVELCTELARTDSLPQAIAHFWSIRTDAPRGEPSFDRQQAVGFHSVIRLAQALGGARTNGIQLAIITDRAQPLGEGAVLPENAPLAAVAPIISQEYPALHCRTIDIDGAEWTAHVTDLVRELTAERQPADVALRGGTRFTKSFEPVAPKTDAEGGLTLRHGGVYVITGGTGGIGLLIAEYPGQDRPGPRVSRRPIHIPATGRVGIMGRPSPR